MSCLADLIHGLCWRNCANIGIYVALEATKEPQNIFVSPQCCCVPSIFKRMQPTGSPCVSRSEASPCTAPFSAPRLALGPPSCRNGRGDQEETSASAAWRKTEPSLFLASLISHGLDDRQHGAESVLSPWPSHSIPKVVLICCYYGDTAGFIRAEFVVV